MGNVWNGDVELNDLRYGILAGVGVDTSFGPCYLAFGAADDDYYSIYFSLGSSF